MNAVRLVARRQVRTLMLAAGVRSSAPAFSAAPLMQLRTAKKAAAKKPAKKVAKKVAKKPAKKVVPAKNVAAKKAAAARKKAAAAKKKAAASKKTAAKKAAAARKRAAVAKKTAARKAAAAKKRAAAAKKTAARKDAAAKKRAIAAKKRAALKEKLDAKRARVEKKREIKRAIKASGPVSPFNLFVQKTTAGKKGGLNTKLGETWKALSEGQKQKYRDEAKKNLAKRRATRQSFKKKPGKYALFVKKNFAAAYKAAKATNSNRKDAFKAAVAAVAKKYKSQ